jgi:hypothetical protein
MATQRNETNTTHISEQPNPSIQKANLVAFYTIPVRPTTDLEINSVSQLINMGNQQGEGVSV